MRNHRGGSGVGLETARIMGKTHYVIICGRTVSKLKNAIEDLRRRVIDINAGITRWLNTYREFDYHNRKVNIQFD